jgi:hypothetical protein
MTYADIIYYAEHLHAHGGDAAYLTQWRKEHPDSDPRAALDVLGDRISQRLAVLADAARMGHRTGKYVAPVVQNVQAYFERSMGALMTEIEECKEMVHHDEASLEAVNDLI